MDKLEYTAYIPEKRTSQRVLLNPAHIEQVAAVISNSNNGAMVTLKRDGHTGLICLFEDNKFKFFYEGGSL